MKKVLILCFFAVCAISCSKTETICVDSSLKESSHVIPIEDAMNGLRQFLVTTPYVRQKRFPNMILLLFFPRVF